MDDGRIAGQMASKAVATEYTLSPRRGPRFRRPRRPKWSTRPGPNYGLIDYRSLSRDTLTDQPGARRETP